MHISKKKREKEILHNRRTSELFIVLKQTLGTHERNKASATAVLWL